MSASSDVPFREHQSMQVTGRLAPTPSGQLHLGNICAFAAAWLSARSQQGRLLLRIEDLDTTRARPAVEADQRHDLEWLGLTWDVETPRQQARDYEVVRERLSDRTYFCRCTRAQIRAGGGTYPGTCRDLGLTAGTLRFRLPPGAVAFRDRCWGERRIDPGRFGDPVLQRRDGIYSYNLAVVADDWRDRVTEVVRGADLLDFTAVQMRLWEALGAPPPTWLHAPLVVGANGCKLSKSHNGLAIAALRAAGWEPARVWQLILPWLGLAGESLADALELFQPEQMRRGPIVLVDLVDDRVPAPQEDMRWRDALAP
ncbi:glutamyl- and glutaminyl-tRNA synthetase [Rubidibacter lacunae KORDI 51-2]|uniref:Glutamyl-and glutaminyl-tRNA synthetase n=1 Tax=Rubidibacter lacunae KORDI 51-2 TaxID=582515 RepID=U5D961_9CHRO|nr:glutamate--tRNA ligase family protein [Rubidibacter lacunae]ERN41108.1 glutamyl- and glutaminyl-tRNA synthetase [Rubidibacter lacunae KORDI 51-2]